ncbi:MAG: hypothetical protein ABEJ82_05925 [Haloplanus sp.]
MHTARYGLDSPLSVAVFAVGVLLVVLGTLGFALDSALLGPLSGPGVGLDADLELLGLLAGVGAVVGGRSRRRHPTPADPVPNAERPPVYVTRALLDTLLEFARRAEPESLSMGLTATPADRLTGVDDAVPETASVFTHLYLPEGPNAVSSVFGLDLQTPPGRTDGRFVTHPLSDLRLTKRDDLHEVVFVAVPPWEEAAVAAFDRSGRRYPVRVVDAVPPDESVPDADSDSPSDAESPSAPS